MDKRYESVGIAAIWSDRNRNSLERMLWIGVMRTQREMGLDIPEDAIGTYRNVSVLQTLLDPDSDEARLEAAEIAELGRRPTRRTPGCGGSRVCRADYATRADLAHRKNSSSSDR
jgi:hypothetical protein